MVLPYNENIVNDDEITCRNFKYPKFLGYLNPNGIPIAFKDKYGYTGHGQSYSIQERFRVYYFLKFKDYEGVSELEKHITSKKYLKSEEERYLPLLKEYVSSLKEEIEEYKEKGYDMPYEQMELEIYNFLINCYSSKNFFEGVGEVKTCMCEEEFWNNGYRYKERKTKTMNDWNYRIGGYFFEIEYDIYKAGVYADIFKEVMIKYLGYHSIERTPKTITTSDLNIYETFYNYLLNDFTIYQLPKMYFDKEQKKYIKQNHNDFYLSDKELRLKDEIQAIKKLVPIKERSKYYR